MRRWLRAIGNTVCCDRCRGPIHAGDPICLISVAGVALTLVQCEACAGPPDRELLPPTDNHQDPRARTA